MLYGMGIVAKNIYIVCGRSDRSVCVVENAVEFFHVAGSTVQHDPLTAKVTAGHRRISSARRVLASDRMIRAKRTYSLDVEGGRDVTARMDTVI